MTIHALCASLLSDDFGRSFKILLAQTTIDVNSIHPELNLRLIDIAAQKGYLEAIKLLVAAGARFARPSMIKATTQNVLLSYLFATPYWGKDETNFWFSEAIRRDDLLEEGIAEEHLHAAFDVPKKNNHRLDIEDGEGLTPIYYASARGANYFNSWISDDVKTDFPNRKVIKGRFANTTGAWWLTSTFRGMDILLTYSTNYLSTINLNITFDIGFLEQTELIPKSVLFRLLANIRGHRIVSNLSDEQFNTIDWNAKEFTCTAALLFAEKQYSARLFQLPVERLTNIDWNARVSCKNPFGVHSESTMALSLASESLANLPAEIINKINWMGKLKGRDYYPLITSMCRTIYNVPTPYFRTLLEKLNVDSLEYIFNHLEKEPLSQRNSPYPLITFEFLNRLIVAFPDDVSLKQNYTKAEIQEKLNELAILFAELKPYKAQCRQLSKKVNGIKGHFLDRMSSSDEVAQHLLTMPNPFFKENSAIAQIIKPVQRMKAIALTYLMRGQKTDRMQGGFLTYSLFQSIASPSVQLNQDVVMPSSNSMDLK